ncbi:hypothetical protein Tsubulata_012951 [Turnera subulata]|uniref:DUF4283 domain-containing protein n=1 Tax=Turnera subulata TaxID=218843 RepID=A0A9Q0JQC0_9ROSI|nr:hypothetical protein Tsubulata_012951 [Turnera subulata]
MASGYILDDAGSIHEKVPLVMDLGKVTLRNPKIASAKQLKGKSTLSVQSLVAFAPLKDVVASTAIAPLPQARTSVLESTGLAATSKYSVEPLVISKVPSNGVTTSWSKVVSTPFDSAPQLQFMQPIFTEDSTKLCIPSELIDIGRKKYSLCLIGQFVGTAPKIGLIHAILNKLWGRDGSISLSHYTEGLFLFQFPNDAAYSLRCIEALGMLVECL